MASKQTNYSNCYSEKKFWKKLGSFAQTMGKEIVIKALQLYYAMALGKATPAQVVAIVAALGYLISPVDFIPDITPGVGFADDAGVLAAVVATVVACSDPEVVAAAQKKAAEWFS